MKVDTMRRLDYYVGVPLCLLGTVIKKLFSIFSFRRQTEQPQNILFIELSEMGSAILADPAMQKLRRILNANLFFAIFRSNRASLELLNTVPSENIFSMRDSGLIAVALDSIRFFFWTRKNCINTVIDLELFSRFTALLTAVSGAGRRVGFHAFYNEGLYRGDFLTHKVAYNPHQHIAKNFIALANALLSDREEVPYSKTLISDEEICLRKVVIDKQKKAEILQKIRAVFPAFDEGRHNLVLFNTNTSDLIPLRRWPQEYYISLAKMILGRHVNVIIMLTGDITEREKIKVIEEEVNNDRCVNFAGRTLMSELTSLYSVSSLMLTNDSGPAHFASVTDMPVSVLFGPESPKLYAPLGRMTPIYAGLACSPCVSATNHRKTPCKDNVCLKIITPEQVFQILKPELDRLAV